jgi:hypothetical protein
MIRDQKVAGSNPVTPAKNPLKSADFSGLLAKVERFQIWQICMGEVLYQNCRTVLLLAYPVNVITTT